MNLLFLVDASTIIFYKRTFPIKSTQYPQILAFLYYWISEFPYFPYFFIFQFLHFPISQFLKFPYFPISACLNFPIPPHFETILGESSFQDNHTLKFAGLLFKSY
jgi:hypothetical protein